MADLVFVSPAKGRTLLAASGGGLRHLLRRAVGRCQKRPLARRLLLRAHDVGGRGRDDHLGPGDTGVLQILARLQVGDRRPGAEKVRFGLRSLWPIVLYLRSSI